MKVAQPIRLLAPRKEWKADTLPGILSVTGSHGHSVDLEVAREYVRLSIRAIDESLRTLSNAVNANEGSAVASDILPPAGASYRGRFYYLDTPWDELYYCSAYDTDATGALLYRWARVMPPEANLLVKDDAVSNWENSWGDLTADPYVGFYRDELTQRLWFMGQADYTGGGAVPTGSGNKMFQLPVGYRPEQDVHFICPDGAVANHEFFLITIDTSGNVYPASVPATATSVDLTVIHARITNMQGA